VEYPLVVSYTRKAELTENQWDGLKALASSTVREMADYQTWVRRRPEAVNTPEAEAMLPDELLKLRPDNSLNQFIENWGGTIGVVPTASSAERILQGWCGEDIGVLDRGRSQKLALCLERYGIGIEPDARYTSATLSSERPLILFRQFASANIVEVPDLSARVAILLVAQTLAAGGVLGDLDVCDKVVRHLSNGNGDCAAKQQRLSAYLMYLSKLESIPYTSKALVDTIEGSMRPHVVETLALATNQASSVSPDLIKLTIRFAQWLGLSSTEATSAIYSAGARPTWPDPVVVRPAAKQATGYAIPPNPEDGLSLEVVQSKVRETNLVSELLGEIFSGEEGAKGMKATATMIESNHLSGLDARHLEFVRLLAQQATWPMDEYRELAKKLGLMPDGASDRINEASLELYDEPLAEGDGPVSINVALAKELSA
jgi:hypothetical protein